MAAFLAGASNSPRVESGGPMLAVAIGYMAFARLERSRPIGVVAALLALVALGVGIANPGLSCVILSLTFGVAFTATGLVLRSAERG